MPVLRVNLNNPRDVQTGIRILKQCRQLQRQNPQQGKHSQPEAAFPPIVQALQHRKIWRVLLQPTARLEVPEYSLPELATLLGLTTNKVSSLKAILAKPEQRLGVQFFELSPAGAVDAANNPRYRLRPGVRKAILAVDC